LLSSLWYFVFSSLPLIYLSYLSSVFIFSALGNLGNILLLCECEMLINFPRGISLRTIFFYIKDHISFLPSLKKYLSYFQFSFIFRVHNLLYSISRGYFFLTFTKKMTMSNNIIITKDLKNGSRKGKM